MGMLIARRRLGGYIAPNFTKAEDVTPSVATPNNVEEVVEEVEVKAEKTYSKTEINRMSTADLKKLANSEGIEGEHSGAELKKLLIAKFGL